MSLTEIFTDPFLRPIVINALVVGVLVSLCSSLLGVSLVLKRLSMIGDGLSHVGFGALALAALFGINRDFQLEFSIPIVVVAAFFLLKMRENSKIKGDSAIALVSTSAMAIGVLIFDFTTGMTTDICANLFSSTSVISISNKDLWISIILSIVVIILFIFFYNKIFSVTFDEPFSKATGIKPNIYSTLISILTAVTIVLGIRMMGAIMIAGLVIFPALTAMRFFKSFISVVICSATLSVTCYIIGFLIASVNSLQTGPTVVVVNLISFIIFSTLGKLTRRI